MQRKREAAYFVVVLHEKRTVLIGVRGTETPEDLITDGLCRECAFTKEDLDGLVNNEQLPVTTRERVISTFPHYGHGGIVEAARELFMQLNDCTGENTSSRKLGFLSTLVQEGSECHGYKIRLVGHSLGGAVATVLGMMLFGRYPDVHVYAYGPLPCVDSVIAEACSHFVTTIIHNDEFSSRLSINSILRLRSAAINALSDNSPADTAMIQKLARRILNVNKYQGNAPDRGIIEDYTGNQRSTETSRTSEGNILTFSFVSLHEYMRIWPLESILYMSQILQCPFGFSSIVFLNLPFPVTGRAVPNERRSPHQGQLCNSEPDLQDLQNGLGGYGGSNSSIDEHRSYQTLDIDQDVQPIPLDGHDFGLEEHQTSNREILVDTPEMFLPGLIIHVVRNRRSLFPLWTCWNLQDAEPPYKAVLAKRENFRDIAVTPSMFMDHLPWRCQYAMQRTLECQTLRSSTNCDSPVQHLV